MKASLVSLDKRIIKMTTNSLPDWALWIQALGLPVCGAIIAGADAEARHKCGFASIGLLHFGLEDVRPFKDPVRRDDTNTGFDC
jgi:hypothetical protein